jgi:plastocyanin
VESIRKIGLMSALLLSVIVLSTTLLNISSVIFVSGFVKHSVIYNEEIIAPSQTGTSKYDQLVNDTIVNGNVQIPPGDQSKTFSIVIPSNQFTSRLLGSYSVKGGVVPVIHLYLIDKAKCVIPLQPSSCSSYMIDEIKSNNYVNITLPAGKTYTLFFSNEANLAGELKNVETKLFLEHYPFIVKVATGQANSTTSINQFFPSKIEVKAGQIITWHNPSEVALPHTVTFVLDGKYKAGVFAPFSIPSTIKPLSIPIGSNSQPTLVPAQSKLNTTIITLNERAFKPLVIDSTGAAKFLNKNGNYTISGNEKYINSGFLLPIGKEKSYPGSSNTFTVKFSKAGRYDYFDIFHPWMTGRIVVK